MSNSSGWGNTVTFLFTDIEGSTRLWEQFPDAMKSALAEHDKLLRKSVETHHGQVIKMTGDGCHAVFTSAFDGVRASLSAQQAITAIRLQIAPAPDRVNRDGVAALGLLHVRMALHSGEAEARSGDYFGSAVNRAARLMAVGSGGQILLSAATAELLHDQLPANVSLLDLGQHRLKDLIRPEHVFQLEHPSLPSDFPPLKSLDSYPNNLPIQLTSFVGRERELTETKHLLANCRLLTLTGSGGAGKTRLALQLGADVLPSFEDGVWIAELAPITEPELVLQGVADALELRKVPSVPLINIMTDYLRTKQLLLILDNCEHLTDACARLADHLLRTCAHLKIVASSREALGIAGENLYRVPSLSTTELQALPSSDDPVKILRRCEAVQFFIERAVAANSRFTVNDKNATSVAQICTRLDGIPLALELAAARTSVFAPDQIAARLDDRFRLLTGGSRTALPRQQTLRAMIDWSYDLLSEQERELLKRLSVFVGNWTFEAAEQMNSDLDVLNILPQLINKSLVIVEEYEHASRYRLLETIRQYARDRLFESGEVETVRDRHLDYYLRFSEFLAAGMRGPNAFEILNLANFEQDNIRTAIEWGLERRADDVLHLLGNLLLIWSFAIDRLDAIYWMRAALARTEALPPAEGEAVSYRLHARSKVLMALSLLSFGQGDYAFAKQALTEIIQIQRKLGDKFILAMALDNSAAPMICQDIDYIRAATSESTALRREIGESGWSLMSTFTRVAAEKRWGDSTEWNRFHEQLKPLFKDAVHPAFIITFSFMGLNCRVFGEYEAARLYLQAAIDLMKRTNIRYFEIVVQSELAHTDRQTGKIDEAEAAYRQLILKWKRFGNRGAIAHQIECLAFVAQMHGQLERAAQLFGSAESLREEIGSSMSREEQLIYEPHVAALRDAMDSAALAEGWAAGRAMSMDQAITFAVKG
ncbi:MAG: adenylate/guanylate cyclase domain-containing protein [Anaerolineae bacterium]|nr:adenylate/guanylate cyclase domain-containing protein [Anaerolineae bacterium]